MSREIKFRVWDKNRKVWGSPLLAMTSGNIHFDWRDRTIINDDIEVMQYTGLKDKNGKEIYEGDIINVWDWGYPIADRKIFGKATVVWDETEKGWRHTYCGIDIDSYDMFRSVEVVGNIYENPELMKGL